MPNESVDKSLYRDHLIRQQKQKIYEFAQEIELHNDLNTKHSSEMTDQILTEKLEREVDTLVRRWLGVKSEQNSAWFEKNKITHLSRQKVYDIFVKFGAFTSQNV